MAAAGVPPGSYWTLDRQKSRPIKEEEGRLIIPRIGSGNSLKAKKYGRKTSCVWEVFNKIPNNQKTGNLQTQCSLCNEICRYSSGSTTAMRNHLFRVHPDLMNKLLKGESAPSASEISIFSQSPQIQLATIKQESFVEEDVPEYAATSAVSYDSIQMLNSCKSVAAATTTNTVQSVYQQTWTVRAFSASQASIPCSHALHPIVQQNLDKYRSIATMCIVNLLPLSLIGTPAFRAMMISFEGGIPIPANETLLRIVSDHIDSIYEKQRIELMLNIADKDLYITAECVKHSNENNMVMYTVNYLSRGEEEHVWVRKSNFLGVKLLPMIANGSSETMRSGIFSGLRELLGPSPSVAGVVLNLGNELVGGTQSSVQSSPFLSTPCFYEILEGVLIIISRYESFAGLSDLVYDIYCKHFKHECQYSRPELIVRKILASKSEFEELIVATGYTWQNLIAYANAITNVIEMIETFLEEQPELIPLSVVLPSIVRLRIQFNRRFSVSSPQLWVALEKYLVGSYSLEKEKDGQYLLALVSFFDPRYKKLRFADADVADSVYARVKMEMKRIEEEGTNQVHKLPSSRLPNMLEQVETPNDDDKGVAASSWESEFNMYVNTVNAGSKTDQLSWWHANRNSFPILSKLSSTYSNVCGSAITAKQAFHCSDAELYTKLQGIEPKYVNKFLFLRKAFPSNHFYIDLPPELSPEVNLMTNLVKQDNDSSSQNDSGISVSD